MPHISLHRSSRERVVIACISLALIFAGLGLLVALPACESKGSPDPNGPHGRGKPAATYTVRGKVESLPSATARDIVIQHEPIADFKDKDGKVVGMGTMSMPFPVAEGVSLDGIAAGDIVEFDFVVWWQPIAYRVTRIAKLPADTKLNFGH